MPNDSRRLVRITALAAAALLGVAGLSLLAPSNAALAHPEVCATHDHDGGDDGDHEHGEIQEICFTQEEIDQMDDSGASLGVDEVSKSANVRQVANIPKQGGFEPEGALNSDLAFTGHYVIDGNYNGFAIYDIRNPERPKLVTVFSCPGSQNDVSVHGNLLITSTDSSRNKPECEGNVAQSVTLKESWEGLRIFDISDPAHPRFVKGVETNCGSHTHTTIPDQRNHRALVYVSSYGPSAAFPDCQPPHDLISIVEIPDQNPAAARVVATPVLFPDGGFPGIPGQTSSTSGCHDITAYPAKHLAAGACMGQGIIMDISNPVSPRVLSSVTDPNFAFWHSATFNNAGTTVVFTDELGGGGGPTCNPTVGPNKGADAIYDIRNPRAPKFASYYKISRVNTNEENCVAHNGSLIPVLGRDVMVQAWYQGGISVWDFTNPYKPKEIAFFERGPLATDRLIVGGSWSAYWYNGKIYSSDIQKGLDVLEVRDWRLFGANLFRAKQSNVQTQNPFWGW
jgi:hypothetical protein